MFDSIGQAQEELKDVRAVIRMLEENMYALAIMTEPLKMFRSLIEEEDEDMTLLLRSKVSHILKKLKKYYLEEHDLQTLLDNWNSKKHNNSATNVN